MFDFSTQFKTFSKKAVLFTCSGLSVFAPNASWAQLSIMGALDSRPTFHAPRPTAIPKNNFTPLATPSTIMHTGTDGNSPKAIHGQTESTNKEIPVAPRLLFSADEISREADFGILSARGNVEISYDGQILIADTLSYNQKDEILTANGNVQLVQTSGDVIFADYLQISSDLKNGIVQSLYYALSDNSVVTAEKGERKAGRYTIAQNATYSPCKTCQDDLLTWQIKADEITLDDKAERVTYSDVIFEMAGVPILYTPYFAHPDPRKKRASGFLTPGFGSQGNIGTFVKTPYFWAISPESDIQITPTFFTDESQLHLLTEYRHKFANGEIDAIVSGTYANGGDGARRSDKEHFRGHIDAYANFDLNDTWRLKSELNRSTDDTYIRKYGLHDESDYGYLNSFVTAEGFRNKNYMNGTLSLYQTQKELTTRDVANSKLEYRYSLQTDPSHAGAYWRSTASAYAINRKNNTKTGRLAADTSWVLPHTSPGGDMYELSANLITTGHYAHDLNNGAYSGTQFAAVPSLTMSWQKPVARSHYNNQITEIFEPKVQVKLAPNVGTRNKTPNEDSQDFEFDDTNLFKNNRYSGLDLIDGGQRVDYGLNWGAYGSNGGYTQAFIGQSYRLREDSTYSAGSGLEDNLSDIVGRVTVAPSGYLNLSYKYRLSRDSLELNRSETGLNIGPNSSRFSLSHLYVTGVPGDNEYGTREEIYANLENEIHKNWNSRIYGRYRMSNPEGTVNYGGRLSYHNESLSFHTEFERNFSDDRDIDPTDTIFFRVELKNLGEFSPF